MVSYNLVICGVIVKLRGKYVKELENESRKN